MKILVVVPTYDDDRLGLLDEAIQSVRAQTRKADSIVVTGRVVHDNHPCFISDEPRDRRLNHAIENSGCDAFVMLSDDDTLNPEFLAETAHEMEHRSVDIVYTDCRLFGDTKAYGSALGEWGAGIDDNTIPLVTSLCSVSAWRKAGGYVDVPFFDWDFWWRCYYTGATAYWLKKPLWNYRMHSGQESHSIDWTASRDFIIKRHIELRKEQVGK